MASRMAQDLRNARKRYDRVINRLEKAASKLSAKDVSYANELRAKAKTIRKAKAESYTGRGGSDLAERQRSAINKMNSGQTYIESSRKATNKQAVTSAQERRSRQEAIFEKQLKMRAGTREGALDKLFFAATSNYWRGAATPTDRIYDIINRTGSADIFEAREKVLASLSHSGGSFEDLKNIMNREDGKLKGWTTEEQNQIRKLDSSAELGDTPLMRYLVLRSGM